MTALVQAYYQSIGSRQAYFLAKARYDDSIDKLLIRWGIESNRSSLSPAEFKAMLGEVLVKKLDSRFLTRNYGRFIVLSLSSEW
jgi:hypothetical protein